MKDLVQNHCLILSEYSERYQSHQGEESELQEHSPSSNNPTTDGPPLSKNQ